MAHKKFLDHNVPLLLTLTNRYALPFEKLCFRNAFDQVVINGVPHFVIDLGLLSCRHVVFNGMTSYPQKPICGK